MNEESDSELLDLVDLREVGEGLRRVRLRLLFTIMKPSSVGLLKVKLEGGGVMSMLLSIVGAMILSGCSGRSVVLGFSVVSFVEVVDFWVFLVDGIFDVGFEIDFDAVFDVEFEAELDEELDADFDVVFDGVDAGCAEILLVLLV